VRVRQLSKRRLLSFFKSIEPLYKRKEKNARENEKKDFFSQKGLTRKKKRAMITA
jgi:hypothetical protein